MSALPSGSVGPYPGPDGMLDGLDGIHAHWTSFELQIDDVIDAPPDKVVGLGHSAGGRGYAGTFGQVWRLGSAKVVEMTSFQSQARAPEHAGLERAG